MELCDHCGLSVGRFAYTADVSGEDKSFCCYGCFVAWQAVHGGGDDSVAAGFLIRLGVGAFLTMNIMLFSLLLYSGTFNEGGTQTLPWVHWLLFILATPALVILGGPFLQETIAGLRKHQLVPAMLITMGASAAYVYSVIATIQNSDRVYFDTAAMVLLLFTLGRYLEANARARGARSLRPILEAEQQIVTRMNDTQAITIPLVDVTAGMIIRVLSGERIPVDGKVTAGESQADESTLTGEPNPVVKNPGSLVMAGTVNGDQALLVEAMAAGLESQWLTICKDVRTALATPTRSQLIAEKATVAFIPTVVVLAVLAFWLHWDPADAGGAMLAGLAVLVVACPCALGLASPLATSLAISRLVGKGIIVRNSAALETLASLRTMAMDKTGTLTAGHITCEDIISSDPDISADDVIRYAAALAQGSKHPLSLSILRTAKSRDIKFIKSDEIEIVPGGGIKGIIAGEEVCMGNARWLEQLGIPIVHTIIDATQVAAEQGHMLTFVAWQGVCRTALVFGVKVHPDSIRVIQSIEKQHIDVIVLTGDGNKQTAVFCRALDLSSWLAELTPEDKKNTLLEFTRKKGPVAMVGDGVNDALALTAAKVGIAVGNATVLARETADVVLQSRNISQLIPLLEIAKTTQRAIVTNLLWAFGYNAVAIVMAVSGILQPIAAAALMAGSSIVVVANTMRCLGNVDGE